VQGNVQPQGLLTKKTPKKTVNQKGIRMAEIGKDLA